MSVTCGAADKQGEVRLAMDTERVKMRHKEGRRTGPELGFGAFALELERRNGLFVTANSELRLPGGVRPTSKPSSLPFPLSSALDGLAGKRAYANGEVGERIVYSVRTSGVEEEGEDEEEGFGENVAR